VLAAVCN